MNYYIVPKEVIDWAKKEAECWGHTKTYFDDGYAAAMQDFLDKINVVYTKDGDNE